MASPIETVNQLSELLGRGELEAAVALYEPDGVLIAQPGQVCRGRTELRAALAGFIALKPTLTAETQQVVEAGNLALYLGRWSLRGTGPDGQEITMGGESSDILRRQPDGRWLIAIDNPWGAQIL